MRITLKKNGFLGVKRTVINPKIMEIKHDDRELVIFFKELNGWGAVSFHPSEIASLEKIILKKYSENGSFEPAKKEEKKSLEPTKSRKILKKKLKKKKR